MGVRSQQKLTWLKDLKTCVRVLGQQVLRGMVLPSAHAGCCKQLRGEKGSAGRRAAQVRRRQTTSGVQKRGRWGLRASPAWSEGQPLTELYLPLAEQHLYGVTIQPYPVRYITYNDHSGAMTSRM